MCEKSNFNFKHAPPANLAKGLAQEDPFTLSVTVLYFVGFHRKCQINIILGMTCEKSNFNSKPALLTNLAQSLFGKARAHSE